MPLTALENVSKSLASYFMFSTADGADLPDNIILLTLLAKKESIAQNNQRFEQLMLDIGKYCDEKLDNSSIAGKTAKKNLLLLVDILQRMEQAAELINNLVFFAHGIPDSETLKELSASWNELNAVRPGLFRELLLDDLLVKDGAYIPFDYKTKGSPTNEEDANKYYQTQLDCYEIGRAHV